MRSINMEPCFSCITAHFFTSFVSYLFDSSLTLTPRLFSDFVPVGVVFLRDKPNLWEQLCPNCSLLWEKVWTQSGCRALSFPSWFVFCLCVQPESDWLAVRAQYWLLWGCNRGWGDGIQDMNTLTVASIQDITKALYHSSGSMQRCTLE